MKKNWAAAMAAGLAGAIALHAETKAVRRDFDNDTAGAEPAFLRYEGSPGISANTWRAIPDGNAFSRPNTAVQTSAAGEPGRFHFALSVQAGRFESGTVQAATKRAAPKGFARGGVVVRYAGPGDFIAGLVDFQSQTISAISVSGGKAETLGAAPIISDEPVWRTVRLVAAGRAIRVFVSDRKVLEVQDPRPRAGEAGLISEAPVPVSFDDLAISSP